MDTTDVTRPASVIAQGTFAKHSFPALVESFSLGRVPLRITAFDVQRREFGFAAVECDQLIAARRGSMSGTEAFLDLCRTFPRDGSFTVTDSVGTRLSPAIAAIQTLMLELKVEQMHENPFPAALPKDPLTGTRRSLLVPASSRPVLPPLVKVQNPGFVVVVASPKGGVGKTTVSLELACSLACVRRRVILVDGSVNGDLLTALAIPHRGGGVHEVLAGQLTVAEALLKTSNVNLRILPAFGADPPPPEVWGVDAGVAAWRDLLSQARELADLVLVDTPAGLYGVTRSIAASATHVVGVLPVEPIATRVAARFREFLGSFPDEARPRLLGVVLNMLEASSAASTSTLGELSTQSGLGDLVFQCHLPRSNGVLGASREGQPVRFADEVSLAGLFDVLASELAERLEPRRTQGPRTRFVV